MAAQSIENNANKKRKLHNNNIIKNTSKLDNSIKINDLQIFIEKPKLIKNNYVDSFLKKKNPLALMMPDDNIFNTEIKITPKNTCNCSFMKDLYGWFDKNIEPIEIICNHNNKNI
jgi:hypothetical protein